MHTNRIAGILIGIMLSATSVAQNQEIEFSADRPGATTGTDIMPKRSIMIEAGMEFENDRTDGEKVNTWNYFNSTFRYGLTDILEMRFSFAGSQTYADESSHGGISNLSLGTKIKLYEGYKVLPKISLLGELLMPGGKNHQYLPERIGGNFHLLFNNELCSWCSLGYDIGMTWIPEAKEETFLGFCLGFAPSEKLGLFVEEYNSFLDGDVVCKSEIGMSYMVHPRVQLDAYTDIDWKHLNKYINVGLGVAWRIN